MKSIKMCKVNKYSCKIKASAKRHAIRAIQRSKHFITSKQVRPLCQWSKRQQIHKAQPV